MYLPKGRNARYVAGWSECGGKTGDIDCRSGGAAASQLTRVASSQLIRHAMVRGATTAALPPSPTLRCPHSAALHRAPRPSPIYIRASQFSSRFADTAERERAFSSRELCGLLLLAIFNFVIIRYVRTSSWSLRCKNRLIRVISFFFFFLS